MSINKFSQGWSELQARQERIRIGDQVIRLLKLGITAELKELEKFPKCVVCGQRFEGDKNGSFNEEKEFICLECQKEME